ncbi:hypothetical protein EX30DRAFT_388873 [Ascodesmis nigricans]|uniref:Uncharacterized protein n=1 Tax=Ascodesmis nigricans TaxID=341454 RepID=A0A4S2MJ16_9PEZI|nr:hypothetical protein EX30DRAFT_388873 [Ascodesmis nigricans]
MAPNPQVTGFNAIYLCDKESAKAHYGTRILYRKDEGLGKPASTTEGNVASSNTHIQVPPLEYSLFMAKILKELETRSFNDVWYHLLHSTFMHMCRWNRKCPWLSRSIDSDMYDSTELEVDIKWPGIYAHDLKDGYGWDNCVKLRNTGLTDTSDTGSLKGADLPCNNAESLAIFVIAANMFQHAYDQDAKMSAKPVIRAFSPSGKLLERKVEEGQDMDAVKDQLATLIQNERSPKLSPSVMDSALSRPSSPTPATTNLLMDGVTPHQAQNSKLLQKNGKGVAPVMTTTSQQTNRNSKNQGKANQNVGQKVSG